LVFIPVIELGVCGRTPPASGHLYTIKSNFNTTNQIRNLEYEYDLMDNVTQRHGFVIVFGHAAVGIIGVSSVLVVGIGTGTSIGFYLTDCLVRGYNLFVVCETLLYR
jgi:hypothetical protein